MREKETDTSCPQCSIFHFLAAIRAVVHSATSRKVFNARVVIGPKVTKQPICNNDKYTITPKEVKINNKLCIIVKNMYMLLRQFRA